MTQCHKCNHEIAKDYGEDAAAIIRHFQYYIRSNREKGINGHDGRIWTRQTVEDLSLHFPGISKKRIEDILDFLTTGGCGLEPLLMKGNFNSDGAIWYTFSNKSKLYCDEREVKQ